MNPRPRGGWLTGLLLGTWLLVVGWQVEEHYSVVVAAKEDLRGSSKDTAILLGDVTRALSFRGNVGEERLDPVLQEMVRTRTNSLMKSSASSLLAVGLLNTDGDTVVSAGDTNLITRDLQADGEHWSEGFATFVWPVEGASLTNYPTLLPPRGTNSPPRNGRDFPRREPPRPDENALAGTNQVSDTNSSPLVNADAGSPPTNVDGGSLPPPPGPRDRPRGDRRPPWMRGMSDADFKALVAKRELHGLVLAMSTNNYRATCVHDLWLRFIISFFAGISALGAGLAWRNMGRTADLQIRLVRASEANSHLKELNLAAAGLAHETRNPLNIIRGQAQMISRLPDAAPDVREKSRTIVDETDKVTAQLTEFINYSRPREVRPTRVELAAAANEIVRTLGLDIEEKKLQVEVTGETPIVEADEQLIRQVLFNLLINAVQAADQNGKIQLVIRRAGPTQAILEVRDDGPGVPSENRQEIFKPYFTTHQKGTGLGLAVVQQIVLAHGWEIVCLGNEPRGAIFRITHLKIAA